jgi:hypothetical protein
MGIKRACYQDAMNTPNTLWKAQLLLQQKNYRKAEEIVKLHCRKTSKYISYAVDQSPCYIHNDRKAVMRTAGETQTVSSTQQSMRDGYACISVPCYAIVFGESKHAEQLLKPEFNEENRI